MEKPRIPQDKLINHSKFKAFTQWVHKHHLALALVVGAAVVAIIFIIAMYSVQSDGGSPFFAGTKKPKEKFYSSLTGLEVADANAVKAPVAGVIVENSPNARPQSGLSKAGIVYEAVAEGGITRFFALYQGNKPAKIGPVRSLRLYYLQWSTPYKASIFHVGGSANALSTVRNGKYHDIDEFSNGNSYWRANDRRAPHNAYTSGEKIDQTNTAKGHNESGFTGFKRADGKPAETPNATQIAINFSGPLFNTNYTYNKDSNTYARTLAGQPHNDAEAGQIAPNSIVALEVNVEHRPGSREGYEDVITVGTGKAYIFQNGVVAQATWKRDNESAELKLIDAAGKDIALNRGQTWIAAFTPGRGSIAWQ